MAGPKKDKLTGDFEEYLIGELQDAEFASEYLNAAIEDGDTSVFLMALGDIAKAQGMSKISKKTGLNRENIYRIVSQRGNPQIKSVVALLNAVGLRITTEPVPRTRRPATPSNVRSFEAVAGVQTRNESPDMYITPQIEGVSFCDEIPYYQVCQPAYELASAA